MEENLFRSIPRVDELLDRGELKASALSQTLLRESVREELDALRGEVRGGRSSLPETDELCARILARAEEKQMPSLRTVINATGVTLHTNLGRACLSERAANAAAEAAYAYSTLEYDVSGLLSAILSVFAQYGANILTINQTIPSNGTASVTVSAETNGVSEGVEALLRALAAMQGVLKAEILAG